MPERPSLYRGHRLPSEVIAHAVRLYLRSALIDHDVEELLAERGIIVSDETVLLCSPVRRDTFREL